jgi:hypothetical protein
LDDLKIQDACGVATDLGIPYHRRGQHLDEYLLYGNIVSDSHRILAMLHGIPPLEEVKLSLDSRHEISLSSFIPS